MASVSESDSDDESDELKELEHSFSGLSRSNLSIPNRSAGSHLHTFFFSSVIKSGFEGSDRIKFFALPSQCDL